MIDAKAKITDIATDWRSGNLRITFELDAKSAELDALLDKELRLKAAEWRNKRSLNANAYFYVLISKIAQAARISNTEAHNMAIAKYGQAEGMTIIMRDDIEWTKLDQLHLRPTPRIKVLDDGKLYRVYLVMRGSHTYDTKEMARLIDGTIEDAKDLGIDTLTPDQIEEMKSKWQGSEVH